MNDESHSQKTQGCTLASCTESWPQLSSGIRYKHLVDYYSYNAFGAYSLSNEEWDNRDMIHNFKNNSELTDPISHLNAMNKAIVHIVLAHHGELEYGSPVKPCSQEAVIVNMLDNLSAKTDVIEFTGNMESSFALGTHVVK